MTTHIIKDKIQLAPKNSGVKSNNTTKTKYENKQKYKLDSTIQVTTVVQKQFLADIGTRLNLDKNLLDNFTAIYQEQEVSSKFAKETHMSFAQVYVKLGEIINRTPMFAKFYNEKFNTITTQTVLVLIRLIILVHIDTLFNYEGYNKYNDSSVELKSKYYQASFAYTIKDDLQAIESFFQEDSNKELLLRYFNTENPKREDFESIMPTIDKLNIFFTECANQYQKSYKIFKKFLEIQVSVIQLFSFDTYTRCNTDIHVMLFHNLLNAPNFLDNHYYFMLLHLIKYPTAVKVTKFEQYYVLPQFNDEQKKQIEGYIDEHWNLLMLIYYIAIKFAHGPQIPAFILISKTINKTPDKFFGASMSKNTYSHLINYLTNMTKKLINFISNESLTLTKEYIIKLESAYLNSQPTIEQIPPSTTNELNNNPNNNSSDNNTSTTPNNVN